MIKFFILEFTMSTVERNSLEESTYDTIFVQRNLLPDFEDADDLIEPSGDEWNFGAQDFIPHTNEPCMDIQPYCNKRMGG